MNAPKHPMQPIVMEDGIAQFKRNRIVDTVVAEHRDGSMTGLNALAVRFDSDEYADDWTQLAQLIGYSVSGAGDLSYFDREVLDKADDIVEAMNQPPPSLEDTQELPKEVVEAAIGDSHSISGTARLMSIDHLCDADGGRVHPFEYTTKTYQIAPDVAGSIHVFPPIEEKTIVAGMTYRQWLIGMAMNGYMGNGNIDTRDMHDNVIDSRCSMFERFADRIIKRMNRRRFDNP